MVCYPVLCMTNTKFRYPNRIRYYRKLHGYTQAELAKLVGISHRHVIAKWERGEWMPHGNHLMKMEYIFNVSKDQLYDHYQILMEEVNEAKQFITAKPFESPFPIDRIIVNDYKYNVSFVQ